MPRDTPDTGVRRIQPFAFGVSIEAAPGDAGSLCIEHFHRVARRALAGEPEEDLLESATARRLSA